MNTEERASSTFSTLRYEPRTTRSQTTKAAIGTDRYFETPKSCMAAAIPANSAIVVAALLDRSRSIATKVGRSPKRSRMSAAKPLPVTAPMRPAISCTIANAGVISSMSHSIL
jgi:hypothetical protein